MNYAFEEFEDFENCSVIFRGIVGSRAYGTANAQSDTDTRGIFVVPSMEYVRLVPPPKQVSDPHNDHTYYSLLRFCELMAEANPTTMEMLYLPENCIITSTPAFETLVVHRDMAGGLWYNVVLGNLVQYVVCDLPNFNNPDEGRIVKVTAGFGGNGETTDIINDLGEWIDLSKLWGWSLIDIKKGEEEAP